MAWNVKDGISCSSSNIQLPPHIHKIAKGRCVDSILYPERGKPHKQSWPTRSRLSTDGNTRDTQQSSGPKYQNISLYMYVDPHPLPNSFQNYKSPHGNSLPQKRRRFLKFIFLTRTLLVTSTLLCLPRMPWTSSTLMDDIFSKMAS